MKNSAPTTNVLQISPFKVTVVDDCATKAGTIQLGALKVDAIQIGATKRRSDQQSARKVNETQKRTLCLKIGSIHPLK